jgi:hypothetical protein
MIGRAGKEGHSWESKAGRRLIPTCCVYALLLLLAQFRPPPSPWAAVDSDLLRAPALQSSRFLAALCTFPGWSCGRPAAAGMDSDPAFSRLAKEWT